MEIRDPLHGTIHLDNAEVAIIETAEFQRLRAIKQTGFAEFSFPGATHNRFLHSLGVTHLAGQIFDRALAERPISDTKRKAFRHVVKLASMLHDVGHGPLSHTTEQVMPPVESLQIKIYERLRKDKGQGALFAGGSGRASHEDYTIKYVTDSDLAIKIEKYFADISVDHVACLIDKSLSSPDDFFIENGIDYRPLLGQIVSSEMDADRMDYLERDSFFCGTNYGKFDLNWLLANITSYEHNGQMFLALNRRALYTFDDFLLSRHHMFLMVYFHHKSIIYEEMLNRYLTSPECTFTLPSDIREYTNYTDYKLHEHLRESKNVWAKRVAERRPYRVLSELHSTEESGRPAKMKKVLESHGIDVIVASSQAKLSKYHSITPQEKSDPIYVVDQYDKWDKPAPIDQSTEIFQKYEEARVIDRLYVAPEQFAEADKLLKSSLLK